jgi:cathepsin A (carboxypeptidase C)
MLENGIRALIYAGDVDFICNWMGNKAWTQELSWSGKSDFVASEDADWKYGKSGTVGGKIRSAEAKTGGGSLTFLQVYEAGHMVPMDQPEAALSLLNDFTMRKYN